MTEFELTPSFEISHGSYGEHTNILKNLKLIDPCSSGKSKKDH